MTLGTVRRGALLLVASALAAGPVVVAPSASATPTFGCPSGEPCVHITFPDGGYPAVDVPASDMDAQSGNDDIFSTNYVLRYSPTSTTDDYVGTGLSMRGLIALIGENVGPGSVTSVTLNNIAAGYESSLQSGDLDDPSPFAGGLEPEFDVYGNDSGIEYVRPERTSTDVNGPDRFLTGSLTDSIDMRVYTTDARPLHPTVTVGKGPWRPGQPVTFSASFAADDPAHQGATFAWTFAQGDPPVPGTQSPTHRYGASGTYTASVEVSGTGPDGEQYSGQSSGVTVRVGKVTSARPGGGGSGTGGKHHPSTGPDKSKHGHHAGSPPTGRPSAAPTISAPPTTVAPTTVPIDTTGSDDGSGPTESAPTSTAPSAGSTTSTATASMTSSPGDAGGALVQGVLLDRTAAPVEGGAPTSDATRVAISARRPALLGASSDARWLWLLVPVLLVVGGALGERRRVPGRHGPQSRL